MPPGQLQLQIQTSLPSAQERVHEICRENQLAPREESHMIVEKLYRDPVHDLIALNKTSAQDRLLIELIDTAAMQRLRRIRQLGMAFFAYQGAEHSRFTHSLGVMHLATRILQHLSKEWRITPMQQLAVRCAALLHDIGHGPFSHVFEQVSGVPHEQWTENILLDSRSDVRRILSSYSQRLPRAIVDIMRRRSHPPFLSQIITSQLDADRFDYLLRDSLMTGVKYGIYDLERLIQVLRLDHRGHRIVIAPNGIAPVEKYLQARFHMYTQVYLHKTVRAAEGMLILLLRRVRELARTNPSQLGTMPAPLRRLLAEPERAKLEDFLVATDDLLFFALGQWQEASDPVLRELARGLLGRKLFKTVDVSRIDRLGERLRAAQKIIEATGHDPRYFIMIYESKSVAYRPYRPDDKGAHNHILVETATNSRHYLDIARLSPVAAGLAKATTLVKRVIFPAQLDDKPLRRRLEAVFS